VKWIGKQHGGACAATLIPSGLPARRGAFVISMGTNQGEFRAG
jgi:hypothetical protein